MEAFNTPLNISNIPFNFSIPTGSSTTTTTNSVTNIRMDSRIWSRLPHRILDRIIAFLPPAAFFRSRSICKRFYALLFSNPFLELYLQISPSHHCFLFFKQKSLKTQIYTTTTNNNDPTHSHEGYLFDPKMLTWHRIPFPLVPAGFSPASSSGGLVCWVSDEAGSKSLLLCNPLFGTSLITPLPSTPRPRLYPSIGLKISSSSIDIVVAGDDMISPYAVKNLTTESFHVDGGGFYSIWATTSSLPRLCSLETGQMVHSKVKFYCMNFSPFSVLCYDIQTSCWSKIQAPMRRFLRSPCLVESKDRILLIAVVEKSKLNVPKSLRIWGLQACGSNWVEIERMPQQLFVQFEEVEGGRGFNCVGNGEFVVVVIRGTERALLFDFWKKRWIWIPPCPFVSGGGELHGFAYEPRLATPVVGLLDQLTLPFQPFNG
ncbi:hypothetical protein LguiB_004594 [Lonicera macranthoides]